jgi:hypothetical protein
LGNQDLERFGADVVEGVGKAVIETWNQDREHKEASGLWRRFGETIWDQLEELRTRLLEACEALGREHAIATGAKHANLRHAVAEMVVAALWKLDRAGREVVDLEREALTRFQ